VEPYNAVLSLAELALHTDETITFDNEALFDICLNTLKLKVPTLFDLNHLISVTMAGVTTAFRYPGQLNTDLRKLMTNMCPYPRLKFFIPGYAPLFPMTSKDFHKTTVKSLVSQLFDPCFQMAGYDIFCGRYLTCAAIFRGLISSKEVEEAMVDVQEGNKDLFVKYIPNSIKTAICDIPPKGLNAAATFLANTSAITFIFNR
jgi:tubulin beta